MNSIYFAGLCLCERSWSLQGKALRVFHSISNHEKKTLQKTRTSWLRQLCLYLEVCAGACVQTAGRCVRVNHESRGGGCASVLVPSHLVAAKLVVLVGMNFGAASLLKIGTCMQTTSFHVRAIFFQKLVRKA